MDPRIKSRESQTGSAFVFFGMGTREIGSQKITVRPPPAGAEYSHFGPLTPPPWRSTLRSRLLLFAAIAVAKPAHGSLGIRWALGINTGSAAARPRPHLTTALGS